MEFGLGRNVCTIKAKLEDPDSELVQLRTDAKLRERMGDIDLPVPDFDVGADFENRAHEAIPPGDSCASRKSRKNAMCLMSKSLVAPFSFIFDGRTFTQFRIFDHAQN